MPPIGKPAPIITRPPGKENPKNFLPIFEKFGVTFGTPDRTGNAPAEICPFCGGTKFSVKIDTGQYQCFHGNNCGQRGNVYTFIRAMHKRYLDLTTNEHRSTLKIKRGIPVQTLKDHQWAWCEDRKCWLVPYMNAKREVLNLTCYWPDKPGNNKFTLPVLPQRLYGLQFLKGADTLFLCEGPFDATALDHHLKSLKIRAKYDILAAPSSSIFRPKWLKYLKDKKVRVCFDNDKAGRDGQDRIAKLVHQHRIDCELKCLTWPKEYPEKYDINDLVKDGKERVVEFTRQNCNTCSGAEELIFTRGDLITSKPSEWLDEYHIPFNTFVSLSGLRGTHKSDIGREYAARATAGRPMPGSGVAIPPINVMIMTSEDPESQVRDLVELAGGDLTKLHVFDITAAKKGSIDILYYMDTMIQRIRETESRLLILDALNSFVGGDLKSDSAQRRTLSGRLMKLARDTGICVMGMRNWGKSIDGPGSSNVLGATSLSDVARCTMHAIKKPLPQKKKGEEEPEEDAVPFLLQFERISGAPPAKPLAFRIIDRHTCKKDSHLRLIGWASLEVIELVDGLRKRQVTETGN
jgi:hypothetical protein